MLPVPRGAKAVFSIENQQGTTVCAVGVWTAAGIPANKIVLAPYPMDTRLHAMISYDGPNAFVEKREFIKNTGLRGFAMWEAAGDFNDILLDTIRGAARFDDCDE
ncbi:hypothetical protein ACEPAH_6324 [Sanghuangporus vaninii]